MDTGTLPKPRSGDAPCATARGVSRGATNVAAAASPPVMRPRRDSRACSTSAKVRLSDALDTESSRSNPTRHLLLGELIVAQPLVVGPLVVGPLVIGPPVIDEPVTGPTLAERRMDELRSGR